MARVIPLHELPVLGKDSNLHQPTHFSEGTILLIDKPRDWTSFDVVGFVRNRIKTKTGHAGTLDPLATGLLVLCTGKATKSISLIQNLKKTYEATIAFGSSTPSFDAATEPDKFSDWLHITENDIREQLENNFSGTIQQTPPLFSALKVDGQRLYKKARRGEKVKIDSRPVTIYNWEIIAFKRNMLTLIIECGKGTYIRSMAHDLGLALESRAHLSELRRTKIGHFSVDDAMTPDEFDKRIVQ
ncbi:MAG: tRNA pseudouridine(55) synthase TruB [Balneolaceae bacterium]